MNTRKLRKILLTLCSALLLVSLSVGMTVAYLTSQTGPVVNTFTVGSVTITLDELNVDEYGVTTNTGRGTGNEYKLIPGHTYTKDPTVHVADNSEDCWLFVKLENGLSGSETSTIESQMATKGWTLVDAAANVYAHESIHAAGDNVVVFETFTLSGSANVTALADAEIIITAYAVQADGFTSAADAWGATYGAPATSGN